MTDRRPRTPRIARWLLELAAPPDLAATMLGDLEEEYPHHVATDGDRAAARWYRRQVLRSIPHLLNHRLGRAQRRSKKRPRGDGVMSELASDFHYALRRIRQAPLFAAIVVGTLALGIAGNTLVYSVVDGVVLNPFPFPDPDGLVGVGSAYPRLDRPLTFWENLSPAEYRDIEGLDSLERVVAWDMGHRQLSGSETAENVFTAFWWGDAFATLGMQPQLGRGFVAADFEQRAQVAVISYRLWSRRFGSDESLLGKPLYVNGQPYTLIGVMPPRALVYGTDLWLPMSVGPEVFPRNRRQFQVLARLAQGTDLRSANAELEHLSRTLAQEYGELEEYRGFHLEAATWTDINAAQARPAALVLLAAVGLVLLLVCVNVASLLLARSSSRQAEIAVRGALGAGRWRLGRQLLTESLTLTLFGGIGGLALATLGIRAMRNALGALGSIPLVPEIALNGRVLAFTAGLSLLTGILVGIAPAVQIGRAELASTLKSAGGALRTGAGTHRLQRFFVGIEVALALTLLSGGGLLAHSFLRLQEVDPGFRTQGILTMRLTLPWEEYPTEAIAPFFGELVERVEALPGVESAGVGSQFPTVVFSRSQLTIEGREASADGALPVAYTTAVDRHFFDTLGIPLVAGRNLLPGDRVGSPLVAVVNEETARRYFPGQDPLGRRFKLGKPEDERPWVEIVGVVGTVRNRGLDRLSEPEIYGSIHQGLGGNQLFLLVRSALPTQVLLPQIREQVAAMDPDQPVYAIRSLAEAVAQSVATRTVATASMLVFAAFALLLAMVGVYGVASYAVNERAAEIGLRVALGASRGRILVWVVRQSLAPLVVGGVVGLLAALGLGRALGSILFEVRPADPSTLVAVVLLFVVVSLVATLLPARRASRLDPVDTLRAE